MPVDLMLKITPQMVMAAQEKEKAQLRQDVSSELCRYDRITLCGDY